MFIIFASDHTSLLVRRNSRLGGRYLLRVEACGLRGYLHIQRHSTIGKGRLDQVATDWDSASRLCRASIIGSKGYQKKAGNGGDWIGPMMDHFPTYSRLME